MNANRNDHSILFSFSSGNPAGTRYNFGSGTFTVADFATQFPSFGSTDLIFPSNLETGNATSTFNFFVGSGSIAEGTSFKIVDMEIFVANNRSDVSCFGTSANALATCNFHGKCIGTDTYVIFAICYVVGVFVTLVGVVADVTLHHVLALLKQVPQFVILEVLAMSLILVLVILLIMERSVKYLHVLVSWEIILKFVHQMVFVRH